MAPRTVSLRAGCKVSQLLALRAAVLRRAISQLLGRCASGTHERAEQKYIVIPGNRVVPSNEIRWRYARRHQPENQGMLLVVNTQRPNPSIEGTSTSGLRPLAAAPHVKR